VSKPIIVADADAQASVSVVLRFFAEVLGAAHDVDAARELLAPDFLDHDPAGEDAGPDGVIAKLQGLWSALPDARFEAELVIASGDWVSVQSHLQTATATVDFADVYRIADGRIAEHWHVVDTAAMAAAITPPSS